VAVVAQLLWRKVTDGDFLCVERSTANTPPGGGGQTYFSISFGSHLDKDEFGGFLGLDDPGRIAAEKPAVPIDVGVLGEVGITDALEFRPRYRDPADPRDRYYIARQNRQRENQSRHPAWTGDRGFPAAPDDIAEKDDPRMPDLSYLKLVVARCDDGSYFADYGNSSIPPPGMPAQFAVLFSENRSAPADGLISVTELGLTPGDLAQMLESAKARPRGTPTSDEVEDARDATARSAGARSRRGQGFRQSAAARKAIDAHAMARATEYMEGLGWEVHDRSIDHPYDLECIRGTEALGLVSRQLDVMDDKQRHVRVSFAREHDLVRGQKD